MNIFKEWKFESKGVTYLSKKYSVNTRGIYHLVNLIDRHGISILDKLLILRSLRNKLLNESY